MYGKHRKHNPLTAAQHVAETRPVHTRCGPGTTWCLKNTLSGTQILLSDLCSHQQPSGYPAFPKDAISKGKLIDQGSRSRQQE